jgi:hypothetical protein
VAAQDQPTKWMLTAAAKQTKSFCAMLMKVNPEHLKMNSAMEFPELVFDGMVVGYTIAPNGIVYLRGEYEYL